jgi:chaperonin GroES
MPKSNKSAIYDRLVAAIAKDNLAEGMDDYVLSKIGGEVVRLYDLDFNSRSEWETKSEAAMKLAKLTFEQKTFPLGDPASSVKFPLIAEASIQFAARAYPEIIKGSDVVKCNVTGDDPTNQKQGRADRISCHMSYQLLKQMTEWEADKDRALHTYPIVGGFTNKSYFSPSLRRNVSELVYLEDYVVNQKSKRPVRRETHRYWYYSNDIQEKMRSGLWLEQDLGTGDKPDDQDDTDIGHEILEQHCFYDLDEDDYKEPLIITVHKKTSKVLRIVSRYDKKGIVINKKGEVVRIDPVHYFTMYEFLPDPAGGFYPLGFGQLSGPSAEAIDSIINQTIDAGTLANRAGGMIARGVRFKGGRNEVNPFEWKFVETSGVSLRDSIFPLPVREPSAVLFQLLGLLIQANKEVMNIKDVLTGQAGSLGKDASPTTVMALIEQGLKVFSGIYKRLYRCLTAEFRKLYRLNSIYLDETESFRVAGKPYVVGLSDYQEEDLEVLPVADPNLASDMQRRLQAQVLVSFSGRPGLNELEVTRLAVKSLHIEQGGDKLLLTDGQMSGEEPLPFKKPPDPRLVIAQAKMQEGQAKVHEAGMRFQLDVDKHLLELEELKARIENLRADTIKKIAEASDVAGADAMELYKADMARLDAEIQLKTKVSMEMTGRQGQGGQMQVQGQSPGSQPTGSPALPPGGALPGVPIQ